MVVHLPRGLIVASALLGAPAAAGPRDYTGAAACGACHAAIVASWKQTTHARAAAPAILGARAKDGACLSCHATTRALPGVQCEACHGPGAAYSPDDIMRDRPLARALGLRDAAASCARCHVVSTSPRPFDAAAAWARIKH